MHLKSDGQVWLATFARTQFGTRTFWVATMATMATMAPEADFAPGNPRQAMAVLAAFVATRLSQRFVEPLRVLVAQSERIGQLQLDKPVGVRPRRASR